MSLYVYDIWCTFFFFLKVLFDFVVLNVLKWFYNTRVFDMNAYLVTCFPGIIQYKCQHPFFCRQIDPGHWALHSYLIRRNIDCWCRIWIFQSPGCWWLNNQWLDPSSHGFTCTSSGFSMSLYMFIHIPSQWFMTELDWSLCSKDCMSHCPFLIQPVVFCGSHVPIDSIRRSQS